MYFKENLKLLRRKKGMAMLSLAIKIGLTGRSDICNYESGYSQPKIETLIKIADYFKVSIDDLLLKKMK